MDDDGDVGRDENVPMWGVLLWWGVCALGPWWAMCSSPWGWRCGCTACDQAAQAGIRAYTWVAMAGFGGLLGAIMLKPTKQARIVAAILVTV